MMEMNNPSANLAKGFIGNRDRGGRGSSSKGRGRGRSNTPRRGDNGNKPICQICGKQGYIVINC